MSTPARRLGATVIEGGTRFEVWAPGAGRVEVGVTRPVDDEMPENVEIHSMQRAAGAMGEHDTWSTVALGVAHADRYRFRLEDGDWLADPASRWQPEGVHGPSAVVDESVYHWHDDGWTGIDLADAVIYELHTATLTREGTFDAAISHLRRLADLGITIVEIMPVASFAGVRNWGYDGVFPCAVQESYGGPEGFARFVDAAHRTGIGVILDVVYNHLGPEGNVLGRYAPYVTDAHHTPWGGAINVAGADSDGVRRYFIESAVGWIRDHHLDGLRLDAVHAIVDPTPIPFVMELTRAVHEAARSDGRHALVTIESSANDPRIVRDEIDHGWGCDAVWNDDVHHALRVALTGEHHEYYSAYRGVADLATAWDRRWVYSGQHSPTFGRRHGAPADTIDHRHFIVFDTNHDHVGNTPDGGRMLADADPGDPRHRLAAATIVLSPFTPMLFMGEEYGETAPFAYFIDHGDPDLVAAVRHGRQREFSGADWSARVLDPADPTTFEAAVLDPTLADGEPHRSRLAMYTELIRLRRCSPVLTDPLAEQHVCLVDDALIVDRSRSGTTTAHLVLNFSAREMSAPYPGTILFDSDDERWAGPGWSHDVVNAWSARLCVTETDPS